MASPPRTPTSEHCCKAVAALRSTAGILEVRVLRIIHEGPLLLIWTLLGTKLHMYVQTGSSGQPNMSHLLSCPFFRSIFVRDPTVHVYSGETVAGPEIKKRGPSRRTVPELYACMQKLYALMWQSKQLKKGDPNPLDPLDPPL